MTYKSTKTCPVVIVGGGFGGLTAALSLSSVQERPPIILIEPRTRFVFLPLLYELLSDEVQSWEVAPCYRTLLASRGIVVIDDLVEKIDLEGEHVSTSSGRIIHYAELIIATGSQPDNFGISGVNEHALTFHKYEDVFQLKRLILNLRNSQKENQNLVIAGAGATGVELACKVSDLLNNQTKVHLIDLSERVLPRGKSFNQEQIEKALDRRSINLLLKTRISRINAKSIELQSLNAQENSQSFSLNYEGLVWTAGVKPSIPYGLPDSLFNNGRVLINSKLQIIGYDNVFAVGDIAIDIDNPLQGTAQVAMQQAEHLVKNLLALRDGEACSSFKFVDRGEMLSMGIGDATITALGLTLSGSIAFQIRRMAYLSKLPSLSLGIRSAGSWLLNSW